MKSIKRVSALARIILIDGLRRYALIGLLGLTLAAELSGLLFFDFFHRDLGRASSDFIFSVSWMAGFIFLFFHAVQVMAWDEERRVIHTFLARPISRNEYVIGVFSGLGALLFFLNLALSVLGWGTLMLIKNSVDPAYFTHFSHIFFVINWLGLFAMELLMLAVIMLFSGLIRGGFPVLLVSLAYYLIASGLPVVREMSNQPTAGADLSALQLLLKAMTSVFPDFSRLDFKNAVVSDIGIPHLSQLMTNFGLVTTYGILALWLACAIYRRRDLQ
jgi:Cu-processing system permease protein